MTDYEIIKQKILDLKAKVELHSITPLHLGTILEEMLKGLNSDNDLQSHSIAILEQNLQDLADIIDEKMDKSAIQIVNALQFSMMQNNGQLQSDRIYMVYELQQAERP